MNIKKLLIDFVTVFVVTLIVSAIVTLLWNFLIHGTNEVDWETSIRLAGIFGVLLTWLKRSISKGNKNAG